MAAKGMLTSAWVKTAGAFAGADMSFLNQHLPLRTEGSRRKGNTGEMVYQRETRYFKEGISNHFPSCCCPELLPNRIWRLQDLKATAVQPRGWWTNTPGPEATQSLTHNWFYPIWNYLCVTLCTSIFGRSCPGPGRSWTWTKTLLSGFRSNLDLHRPERCLASKGCWRAEQA